MVVLVNEASLSGIASAIRSKNGTNNVYKPGQMAAAIQALPGAPTLQSKTANANGTVTPDTGYDGLSQVTVNVPNSYSQSDEGKVVSNGALVAQTARSGAITQNGTYDTTNNNEVTVNVSGGGGGSDDPFAGLNDYILSDGNQYINTGYIPADNARIECVAEASTGGGAYATLFGVRDSGGDSPGTKSCLVFVKYRSNVMCVNWGSGATNVTNGNNVFYGTKTLYKLTKGTYLFKDVSGTIIANIFASSSSASSKNSIFLFGLNEGGSDYGSACRAVAKLYAFRVYEGSTLAMELLPAVDGNNKVCLQDTVSGNYFYNSGTGTFTYGTDS